MPYEIRRLNGRFCVAKQGEADTMECYDDKASAERYLDALYANVPEARQMAQTPLMEMQTDEDGNVIPIPGYDADAAMQELLDLGFIEGDYPEDEETDLVFLGRPEDADLQA